VGSVVAAARTLRGRQAKPGDYIGAPLRPGLRTRAADRIRAFSSRAVPSCCAPCSAR